MLALTRRIINLAYPMRCACCGRSLPFDEKTGVCAACLGGIKANPKPFCPLCGRSMNDSNALCPDCRKSRPAFVIARSACLYEGTIKELVHLYKYRNNRSLAALFAGILTDFLNGEDGLKDGTDIVTFVPLHPRRMAERDFNQSERLGRNIALKLGLPAAACLMKTVNTRHQNELPRNERLENLRGAFRALPESLDLLAGRRVLLVDDVMTTGATLDECSRVLMDAGAGEVRCVTLARGL